jgi:hypothetical protein
MVAFVANSVEVDDLISQLTRGKHSIYTPVYKLQCTNVPTALFA